MIVCTVASPEIVPPHLVEMAEYEQRHWWYLGLRDLLSRLLVQWRATLTERPRVLDAGCGTGANLRLLADVLRPGYLAGFDISDHAVRVAETRCPEANVYVDDITAPQVDADPFDLILSCDVCSVPGLDACRGGLSRLANSLRPGGRLVLHLPAYDWLYSPHDRAVGHTQRFSLGETTELLREFGLSIELATYRMSILFPAVLAARLPSLIRRGEAACSDLRAVPEWLNDALFRIVAAENRLTARGCHWPVGSSLIVVGRHLP
ncbi:MAG TPA: class I SAM-dependent methyltransferase [Pirellulales bacterium]|jgi:SAM-dependent methyltransferase|nr:class I SAM-dependent methyltransferase [Pirellulales bacterium]